MSYNVRPRVLVTTLSDLSHVLTQSARCVGREFRNARGALCEEHHVLSKMQRANTAQQLR